MPEFEIIAIGSGEFLEQIFIALASFVGSDYKSYNLFWQLGAIGAALGAIMAGFQSIYAGGTSLKPFSAILGGAVIFACMFGFPCSVKIVDAHTTRTVKVDNVPIGIGVAGFAISSIGYNITEAFELAFAPIAPGISSTQVGDYLKILNDLRGKTTRSSIFTQMNEELGDKAYDTERTLENFFANCVYADVDIGNRSPRDIYSLPILDSMNVNNDVLTTQVFTTNANGQWMSCKDANAEVSRIYATLDTEKVKNLIDKQLGLVKSSRTWQTAIDSSMEALGLDTVNVQQYVFTNLVLPIYESAARAKYESSMDTVAAMSINNEIQRRNLSWATEATLFEETIQPLMTFMEGFSYAVTPFIALLLLMGTMGTQIAARYLQTLIWIQLWLPMMAIVNLYMYMSCHEMMEAISPMGQASLDTASMYLADEVYNATSTWLAIGAKMMVGIPVISLAIVTGSSYGMVSLMDKVSASNAKAAEAVANNIAPPVMNMGAAFQAPALATGSGPQGANWTGGDLNNSRTFSTSQAKSAALSATQADAYTASKGVTTAISSSIGDGLASTKGLQFMDGIAKNIGTSNDTAWAAATSKASHILERYGFDSSKANDFLVQGSLSALGNGVSASWKNSDGVNMGKTLQDEFNTQFSKQEQVGLTNGITASISSMASDTTSLAHQVSTNTGYTQAASNLTTQTSQVQAMQQFANQSGAERTVDLLSKHRSFDGSIQDAINNAPAAVSSIVRAMWNEANQDNSALYGFEYKNEPAIAVDNGMLTLQKAANYNSNSDPAVNQAVRDWSEQAYIKSMQAVGLISTEVDPLAFGSMDNKMDVHTPPTNVDANDGKAIDQQAQQQIKDGLSTVPDVQGIVNGTPSGAPAVNESNRVNLETVLKTQRENDQKQAQGHPEFIYFPGTGNAVVEPLAKEVTHLIDDLVDNGPNSDSYVTRGGATMDKADRGEREHQRLDSYNDALRFFQSIGVTDPQAQYAASQVIDDHDSDHAVATREYIRDTHGKDGYKFATDKLDSLVSTYMAKDLTLSDKKSQMYSDAQALTNFNTRQAQFNGTPENPATPTNWDTSGPVIKSLQQDKSIYTSEPVQPRYQSLIPAGIPEVSSPQDRKLAPHQGAIADLAKDWN